MLNFVPALTTAFFMTATSVSGDAARPFTPPAPLPYSQYAFLASGSPRITRKNLPERSARTQRRNNERGDIGWYGGAYAL